MSQTIAQAIKEEGRQEGRQEGALDQRRETLLRLLKNKFQDVPAKTRKIIQATADNSQLDRWIDRVMTVETLAELGIGKRM